MSVIANKGPSCGSVDVYVDNVYYATVDLYQTGWVSKEVWTKNLLASGSHTVTLYNNPNSKNPLSSGSSVYLDAFVVY